MDRIEENLFIGSIKEKGSWEEFDSVINLSRENIESTSKTEVYNIPVDTGNPGKKSLEKAVNKALEVLEKDKKLLICCRQGVSRSVGVTSKVLSEKTDKSFRESIHYIEKIRPVSNPSMKILKTLEDI